MSVVGVRTDRPCHRLCGYRRERRPADSTPDRAGARRIRTGMNERAARALPQPDHTVKLPLAAPARRARSLGRIA